MRDPTTPIDEVPNVGPVTARELRACGIATLGDVLERGWEETFLLWVERYPERVNVNAATGLAAIVEGCDWRALPAPTKERVRAFVARTRRERR